MDESQSCWGEWQNTQGKALNIQLGQNRTKYPKLEGADKGQVQLLTLLKLCKRYHTSSVRHQQHDTRMWNKGTYKTDKCSRKYTFLEAFSSPEIRLKTNTKHDSFKDCNTVLQPGYITQCTVTDTTLFQITMLSRNTQKKWVWKLWMNTQLITSHSSVGEQMGSVGTIFSTGSIKGKWHSLQLVVCISQESYINLCVIVYK